MSTVPASPSKQPSATSAPSPPAQAPKIAPKTAPDGRPETLQYEVAKREADALAAAAAAKSDWARVTPASTPPPPAFIPPSPPPEDLDRWGTSTLVGQQAPTVAAPEKPQPPADATGKTRVAERGPDVGETLQRGATQLAGALGSGFRAATRSLAESSPGSLEALLPGAPAVDLIGDGPIVALSTRLAAESDFWRRLGLRSLSRTVIADRVGYVVSGLAVLSGLGLAVVGGLGGLFAGEHAAGKSVLVLVGAFALLCAGSVAFAFTHAIRRAQQDAANGAFARADHAELRLHRVAIAIALRSSDPDAFRDALARVANDDRV